MNTRAQRALAGMQESLVDELPGLERTDASQRAATGIRIRWMLVHSGHGLACSGWARQVLLSGGQLPQLVLWLIASPPAVVPQTLAAAPCGRQRWWGQRVPSSLASVAVCVGVVLRGHHSAAQHSVRRGVRAHHGRPRGWLHCR